MAFNDLTAGAQEGLNFAAQELVDTVTDPITGVVTVTPQYATGRLYSDSVLETKGQEWLAKKQYERNLRRTSRLNKAANAALAAQVDALSD